MRKLVGPMYGLATFQQKQDINYATGRMHINVNQKYKNIQDTYNNVSYHISSHARTVVRECCKGDDESQWERVKFDPPPPKNPLTDGHQNLRT